MAVQNPTDIISLETRHLIALCARVSENETAQAEVLSEIVRHFPSDKIMIALMSTIDWTDKESIRPLLKLIGLIRKNTKKSTLNLPAKLDRAMAVDGFRFNREWQLVKNNPRLDD